MPAPKRVDGTLGSTQLGVPLGFARGEPEWEFWVHIRQFS
jgi:hypothetical protein